MAGKRGVVPGGERGGRVRHGKKDKKNRGAVFFFFRGLIQRGGRFNFGAGSAGIFSGEGPLYSALSRQEKKRELLPERR